MNVFFDTSVLIAAVNEKHSHHSRAFPALTRVQEGKDEGFLSGHTLAEMYAILTKLPAPFRHTPEQALLSIEENVLKYFKTVTLGTSDYPALIREAALMGVQGGTVYDSLLLKAAGKAKVQRILTFNLKHFQAIAPKALIDMLGEP